MDGLLRFEQFQHSQFGIQWRADFKVVDCTIESPTFNPDSAAGEPGSTRVTTAGSSFLEFIRKPCNSPWEAWSV